MTAMVVAKFLMLKTDANLAKENNLLKKKKVLEIPVDKGVPNHHKYPYMGESDEKPGMMAGDLVVIIEEKPHEIFKRKNADLIILKKISLKEALVGYKF